MESEQNIKNKRQLQLKFIASIFNLTLKEIKDTLGFEALTMIFRRVGESSGENIANRFKGKYKSVEEFGKILIDNIISPIIGEGKSSMIKNGDTYVFKLDACPYKKAGGFPISDMSFFCDYTQGMIETAIKKAFPDKKIEFKTDSLISNKCESCSFSMKTS